MNDELNSILAARLACERRERLAEYMRAHPYLYCAGSVSNMHSPTGRDGVCHWCGLKVERKVPMPTDMPVSEATHWYRQMYDPDYDGD